jgi:small GTP-binding protein
MQKEFVFKIALLGASGVGKTSLIYRFIDNTFSQNYKSTIGTNILPKDINISIENVNYDIRLVLWDMAGQDLYEKTRSVYFHGCAGAILVYDVTRPDTLYEIEKKWIKDFRTHAKANSTCILIGNKKDLSLIKKVEQYEGSIFSDRIKAACFTETSAKTGENVEECFTKLVKEILSKGGVTN